MQAIIGVVEVDRKKIVFFVKIRAFNYFYVELIAQFYRNMSREGQHLAFFLFWQSKWEL